MIPFNSVKRNLSLLQVFNKLELLMNPNLLMFTILIETAQAMFQSSTQIHCLFVCLVNSLNVTLLIGPALIAMKQNYRCLLKATRVQIYIQNVFKTAQEEHILRTCNSIIVLSPIKIIPENMDCITVNHITKLLCCTGVVDSKS